MKSIFQSLGADEKETQVFLRMLELGAQPISVMAKFAGVPRSSMYVILERLKGLNLIQEFKRNGIKYVRCIPVDELGDLLKMKERSIQQSLKVLQEKSEELKKTENRLSLTPKVTFYEGKKEVMKLYEQVLKEKRFYAVFNPQKVKIMMPEYHDKIPETIKAGRLHAKEFVVYGPEAKAYKNRYNSRSHQIKILPKERQFEADTIITAEKIYMIAYGKNEVSGVEIINQSLAEAQQTIFEALWDKSG